MLRVMMSSLAVAFLYHSTPQINSNVTGSTAEARNITSLGGHFSYMFLLQVARKLFAQ